MWPSTWRNQASGSTPFSLAEPLRDPGCGHEPLDVGIAAFLARCPCDAKLAQMNFAGSRDFIGHVTIIPIVLVCWLYRFGFAKRSNRYFSGM
jgi:hypothetical protein